MQIFTQSEATAARRRFELKLVSSTDGRAAATGEAAGQPQISKNGGAWVNTTATLVHTGSSSGAYYVELTTAEIDTLGTIRVRYKSANTDEYSSSAPVVAANLYGTPSVNVTQWKGDGSIPSVNASGYVPITVAQWNNTAVAPPLPTFGTEEAQQAQAGGANTITFYAGASATNDLYKGLIVHVYSGTGAGQSRYVTAYDGATKVATVDSAWAVNPNNTSLYVLRHAGGMDANVTLWRGVQPSTLSGTLVLVQTHQVTAGAISEAAFDGNAVSGRVLATDAVTEIQAGLATAAAVTSVQADTDNIQTRLPATLIGGKMDAVATDTATMAAAVWAHILESVGASNYSAADLVRLLVAILAGDGEDLDGPNPLFKSLNGIKTRISGVTTTDTRNATLGDLSQ